MSSSPRWEHTLLIPVFRGVRSSYFLILVAPKRKLMPPAGTRERQRIEGLLQVGTPSVEHRRLSWTMFIP